jgi:predicted nucleic acid-binding protein
MSARIVVSDASVVINFSYAGLLTSLPSLTGMSFVVTDVVYEEVNRPQQRLKLDEALAADGWAREALTDPAGIAMQADLMMVLDRGEASSLALAAVKGCLVACDERHVFLREADARLGPGRVVNTPGLIVMAIRAGHLSIVEADRIKAVLEGARYKMKFASFADVI